MSLDRSRKYHGNVVYRQSAGRTLVSTRHGCLVETRLETKGALYILLLSIFSINVNWIKLIDGAVQVINILIDFSA